MDLFAAMNGSTMVDMGTVRTCFHVMHTHDRVSMCADIVKRNANSGTVEYFWGKTKVEKTDEEQEHFNRFWRPQGFRVMDWVFCCGLIPVTFEQIDCGGQMETVPRVLSPEEGSLWICKQNDGPAIYKWSNEKNLVRGMQFDEQVVVLSGFNYDPEITGVVQSIVSTLLIRITNEAYLIDASALANRIRANPPYIHQYDPAQETAPGAKSSSTGYATNQDREFMDAWNAQQRAYEFEAQRKEETIAVKTLFKKRAEAKNALQQQIFTHPWDGNIHKVPYGLKYVAAPIPQGPEELSVQLATIDERICNRMGVPISMISSTKQVVTTDDSVNEQFVETIGYWKEVLSRFYTVCEIIIHAEKDAQNILTHFLEKNQSDEVTEYDLFELQRNTEVRVHCPMPQFLTMEQLHFCLQNNAITREEFILHMRKKARFPDPTPAQLQELLQTAQDQYDRENPPPAPVKSSS